MTERSESSAKNKINRVSTLDGVLNTYDHAINLVDTTAPADVSASDLPRSDNQSWRQLARNATQTSIKEQFARRKYARWQQDRYESKPGEDVDGEGSTEERNSHGKKVDHEDHRDSQAVDFADVPGSQDDARVGQKKKRKHREKKHEHKEEAAIDILYENQRGAFLCGIPLYSHSSLLNFDPAPWVTKDYRTSAVNITNAQVPDPSWQWAWKHWYVDMSQDVDEDGWQYSFAFFGKFAWHGTHPWFHSFCRRRRWLRKRVKPDSVQLKKPQPSSMSAAHRLNTDYFTIHSKRDRSPNTLDGGPRTARPDSFASYATSEDADEIPEDIGDIATLLKALRKATVDREKIEYVKSFVEHGGEELAYLNSEIPGIMHFLIFQNSKRQLLEFLKQKANEAQDHRNEHDADDRPEGEAESRRIDNLLKAVDAANEQIKGLEYWSDRKHVLKTTEDPESLAGNPLITIFDEPTRDSKTSGEDDVAGEIKGIDKKAGIGKDPTRQTVYRGATLAPTEKKDTKGKGKEKEVEEEEEENDGKPVVETRPQLKADQMFVPDEEST